MQIKAFLILKILFFIDSLLPGGKERRLVELIKGLHVTTDLEMELVLLNENIHYREIFETQIKIHFLKRGSFKWDPRIVFSFLMLVRNIKPDIIHVWSNIVAVYSLPAKIVLDKPLINNQIGDAPKSIPKGFLNKKMTFPFSDRIVSNSAAGLEAYQAPERKSRVIYNGFDMGRISNLEDPELIRKKFDINTKWVVGMVATFSSLKDYETYLRAAALVLKNRSDVTFLCIGSGNSEEYQKSISAENKDKILFLGKQDNVESIMNCCDIGILSTFTEGISNALMEFSALGKPVITTYGGGNSELVRNGKTGYLIPMRSPVLMKDHIIQLLEDDSLRSEFGTAGKKRIESSFSLKKMVKEFMDLYSELSV